MRKSVLMAAILAVFAAGGTAAQNPGTVIAPAVAPATTVTPPAPVATPQAAPIPGRVLAATCSGCHGTGGRSVAEIPSINGKTETQIRTAMLEFKNDRRPATVMNRHAKGFSDEEIAAIAREISANWR